MPKYLVRASYTAEGARGLLKDGGSKRAQVVTEMMKSAGATVEGFYFALGEHDAYTIIDAPDTATITALALATNASGAPQEVDAAVKKPITYTPPGR
jgi:uncharacterized protein with GYD domain